MIDGAACLVPNILYGSDCGQCVQDFIQGIVNTIGVLLRHLDLVAHLWSLSRV